MKICIGISSGEYIKTKTVATIVSLVKLHPELDLIIKQSCLVHKNRNDIVEEALKKDYTHIFFIDSDMCFSPKILERLLSRDKDIVAGDYNKRNLNKESVVKLLKNDIIKGKYTELFECESAGTGCMLIKTDVFKNIPKPYFAFSDDIQKEEVGEDTFFCLKAKRYGYKIYCDPTIEIGHIGEYIY